MYEILLVECYQTDPFLPGLTCILYLLFFIIIMTQYDFKNKKKI